MSSKLPTRYSDAVSTTVTATPSIADATARFTSRVMKSNLPTVPPCSRLTRRT